MSKNSIFQKELNAKDALLVITIIALILIYIFVFVYPKYNDFKLVQNKLEDLKAQKSEYELQINKMPELEATLESLEYELDNKSKQLKHNMEDGMFLIGLSKKLQEYNVELINYSIEDSISYDGFYCIPTNIELKGDYKNVRAIMDYMQNQKNITQILDYTIEAYVEQNVDEQNIGETKVIDEIVYWTDASDTNLYHKVDCEILKEEIISTDGQISHGDHAESGKESPCEECKPYTIEESEEDISVSTLTATCNGEVSATFSFIMYSADEPTLDLNNDDSSTWQPGKFNPFTTTTTIK